LQGKKLGIIGFRANGSQLAQKAHLGLGVEIIGYDPYLNYTKMPSYYRRISISTLNFLGLPMQAEKEIVFILAHLEALPN